MIIRHKPLPLSPSPDKHLSLSENIQELQRLLAGVGVSQQTAVRCLTPQAATLVVKCVTTSLFQHYRLFQCLFEEHQEEQQLDVQVHREGQCVLDRHIITLFSMSIAR